jgi:large subunit ribosomal protein L14
MQTRLKVADNSGAKEVMFIRAVGGDVGKIARIGDIFVGSVKLAEERGQIGR